MTEEPVVRLELPARPGTIYLANVGSTGLPFPGKGPPSCAVYDSAARRLEQLVLGAARGRMIGASA